MAKQLKLNIKNTQIAEAVNLSGLKSKLAKKKAEEEEDSLGKKEAAGKKAVKAVKEEPPKEEAPRVRARSKSAFAETPIAPTETPKEPEELRDLPATKEHAQEAAEEFAQSPSTAAETAEETPSLESLKEPSEPSEAAPAAEKPAVQQPIAHKPPSQPLRTPDPTSTRLGPTGRHIKDYLPKPQVPAPRAKPTQPSGQRPGPVPVSDDSKSRARVKGKDESATIPTEQLEDETTKKGPKAAKFKDFRDVKPTKRVETKQFDSRDRQGLRTSEDEQERRRRRHKQMRPKLEEVIVRPTSLTIRTPISLKDLASEMKLKASELIGKLFLQGIIVTLNDQLEDETTIQLLGHEFGCEITIDKTEEKRIRITDQTIKEELQQIPADKLQIRPPVVAFMGHVDHGKTSLIDYIRKSNRAAGEAGAITQHIGAFRCSTPSGDITVLDTPGHEAFSAMRARGADVTDIVVLVVAGDEGLRQQTLEAMQHAKAAGVIIVVAINKSDKPNYNAENVYRQMAENDLLPEVWGGQTITVNCSAVTGEGIPQLLEMLALQAEVLELRAAPDARARGTVLESELHKGMGHVATVLVQNGTLHRGDAIVFGQHWGRVKTMHDEYRTELQEAGPSTPVEITGLSGLPIAGQEFIVVKSEREAREIADVRSIGVRQTTLVSQQKKKTTTENLLQQTNEVGKKILNLVIKADVQGSLEALKAALLKIESDKVDLMIIFAGVGDISESDVQLAAASKAVIIGFHTNIESHAEPVVKQYGVQVRLHEIIYHAIDDVKLLMAGQLDKIAQETEKGKALVKATFKSSHTGVIAGCQVIEGTIQRSNQVRLRRGQEVVWKGSISSLKRVKEDVREVQKGLECGILLANYSDIQENDIIEAYEVTYIEQKL